MIAFKQKINSLKTSVFSKKGIFVLFFLLFIIISFFPTKNTYAIDNDKKATLTSTAPITVWEKTKEAECSIGNLPRCFILIIFKLSGLLLVLSGTLFTWIIDTANIKLILSGTSTSNPLYELWQYVRDVLNMAFIMMLLFSAFCTIFQIEAYNYKKMLWKIVLMALLVNFSFPITRFIIDASNILMYSLIKTDLLSTSSLTDIASSNGALKDILNQETFPTNSSLLIASVMIFMLAITFLAIGILLLVRMIALAILIIFSPIAFVGTILPGASSYASKWWDNLFKYSFFGPIMIFGIIIATKLMNGIGASLKSSANLAANADSIESNFIGSVAYMSLPIVLLWMVMGVAQSMSIAGAGAVMSKAQGAMKWAGMKASGASFVRDTFKAYQTRRAESKKDSRSNRLGTLLGSKQDQLRGQLSDKTGRDAANRYNRDQVNRVKQESERRGMADMANGNLENLAQTGNRFESAAAIQELASRSQATQAQLDDVRESFGETSQVFTQLASKVKTYDPVAAFAHLAPADQTTRWNEFIQSNQFDLKKMNNNSLGNTDFMGAMFTNNAADAKSLENIRNSGNEAAISTSLTDLARTSLNTGDRTQQAIHLAAFAHTGNIVDTGNAAVNQAFANNVFGRLDKDTAKRMNLAAVTTYGNRMSNYLKPGQYKSILTNINNSNVQRNLNTTMQAAAGSQNARSINNMAHDPEIIHIHN